MAIDESSFRPSNAYGLWSVAKNLVPLLVLYASAPILADRSLLLAWALTPVIGLLIYRLTMVMHDCGHSTLFVARSWNDRVGKLLGFVSGVDFWCFRNLHWEHHRNFGSPGDPQGFHYLPTETMSRPEYLWHIAKPLLGFNLKYVFPESLLSPKNFRKVAFSTDIFGLLLVQAVILMLISGGGRHLALVLLPPLAAATFGLFFSQLRGMAEHGTRALNAVEPQGFVKSHRRDLLGSLFLYDVHFNYHAEHHRYPGVPSYRLPEISISLGGEARPGSSMWQSLARMVAKP